MICDHLVTCQVAQKSVEQYANSFGPRFALVMREGEFTMLIRQNLHLARLLGSAAVVVALCIPVAMAQDHDRDGDRDRDRYTKIEPGTTVAVRTNQTIDVNRSDNRVYTGIVDQDVRGENGRLAIPRGSAVELMVRVAPDNDLILDLDSVMVNGQRFAIKADANRVESKPNNSLVGAIVGAIQGVQVHGPAVRVPRDSVLSFRIDRPMLMGVPDRGYDRDGYHYHGDRDGHDK